MTTTTTPFTLDGVEAGCQLLRQASEVEAARASLPAPTDAEWMKEAALKINRLILLSGAKIRSEGDPPEDRITDADIDRLESELLAHLRARPAEPTPSDTALRQCLEALEWAEDHVPRDNTPRHKFITAAIDAARAALKEQAAAHLFPSLTAAQFWCHKASHGESRCPQECDLCSAETSDDPLLKRLRDAGNDYTLAWGSGDLYDEAADEIERLAAVLARIRNGIARDRCDGSTEWSAGVNAACGNHLQLIDAAIDAARQAIKEKP